MVAVVGGVVAVVGGGVVAVVGGGVVVVVGGAVGAGCLRGGREMVEESGCARHHRIARCCRRVRADRR